MVVVLRLSTPGDGRTLLVRPRVSNIQGYCCSIWFHLQCYVTLIMLYKFVG